ncbi:hypothetical protein K503DRAFT_865292, partial [Rhizopogon vinicolor AM-OR11-026]
MSEAIRLTNTYDSFTQLGERVHVTLRTQLGDLSRLNAQKAVCLQFLEAMEQHLNIIPPAERHVIQVGVDYMIHELEAAATISSDSPDADPISLGDALPNYITVTPASSVVDCLNSTYHRLPPLYMWMKSRLMMRSMVESMSFTLTTEDAPEPD